MHLLLAHEHLRSRRYEWIEMVLLHKSLFASKWMQALHLAFGDSFSANNAFALLYVMYNPVCRKDIHRKNRLANKMLAEALHPVLKEYSGQAKRLGFYIKSTWAVLKFAVKNRALADCNPTLVVAASQQPHAALFKDVNRILMLVNNCERSAKADWKTATSRIVSNIKSAKAVQFLKSTVALPSDGDNHEKKKSTESSNSTVTWLQKIRNCWKRSNKVFPSDPDDEQRHDDAPKSFVDAFALKREFVADNIEEEARLSLLTLMMFPDKEDFGSSRECKLYKDQFDVNLEAFRRAFRALFRLSKDLEFADSSEKLARLTRKERFFQRVSDVIFGEEMKLLRNFHWLTGAEAVELFQRHNFPELEVDDFEIPTVDEVLQQLLAVNDHKPIQEPENSGQAQISMDISVPRGSSSTLMSIASAIQEASHESRVNPAHMRESDPHIVNIKVETLAPSLVRPRPSMYSSKNLLVAAKANTDSSDSQAAELTDNKSREVATLTTELAIEQERSTAALQRAAAADVDVQTLTAQVKDMQMALLKQPSSRAISKPESQSGESSFKHVCCQLSCQCSC